MIATALFDRFISQGEADFENKLLSAMRKQFGGHAEKKIAGSNEPSWWPAARRSRRS